MLAILSYAISVDVSDFVIVQAYCSPTMLVFKVNQTTSEQTKKSKSKTQHLTEKWETEV